MKKLLSILLISLFGLLSFGYCFNSGDLANIPQKITQGTYTCSSYSSYSYLFESVYNFTQGTEHDICIYINNLSAIPNEGIGVRFESQGSRPSNSRLIGGTIIDNAIPSISDFENNNLYCFKGYKNYLGFFCQKNIAGLSFNYTIFDINQLTTLGELNNCNSNLSNCQGDLTTCQNSSCNTDLLQCQNDYSSCSNSLGTCGSNLNSCQNALGNCMNGQVGTGINWSSLFINNIQHLGKPIINITIPEEIDWDYTNSGSVFDLNIVGYNVDPDYIDGIINLQNIKPTEEDFNKLVSEVVPLLVPGLFIIAFLYFVFRFIKKVF